MPLSRKIIGYLFILIVLNTCIPVAYSQKAPAPPKVSVPKLPKDTAVKAKLIKKILSAFKFRKNARAKEQERVITIINQILTDSLVVTARDIQLLNEQLSKMENQHFDSLVMMINDLSLSPAKDTPKPKTDTSATIVPNPENDLNALVSKMLPILQQKNDLVQTEKAKQEKLKTVRAVYGRASDLVDTLHLNDSTGVRYTVSLAQKVNVMGIHPPWMGSKFLNYNFSALTTFSFMGYTIDGKTGRITPAFNTDSVEAILAAKAAGCNIQLIISGNNANNIPALLQQPDVQLLFADTLASLLRQQQANGVTIYFKQISSKQRQAFTNFIVMLSSQLRSYNAGYSVNVVIPSFDKALAFDLQAMNAAVTFFLVDFTQASGNTAGALAPLKGNPAQAIDATLSRYLQRDIPPAKFMLLLPYYGAVWKKGSNGAADIFSGYISYRDIKTRYPMDTAVLYDENAEAAFIEVKNAAGNITTEIWFDDASTLGTKYDYVLNNDLGGVAIWTLGADDGYSDLWDELTDKFVVADTVRLDTVRLIPPIPVHLTFWQKVQRELRSYQQMFRDPCSVNTSEYLGEVYFQYAAILLLFLSLAAAFLYVAGIRNNGDNWKWKNKVLILLMALLLLFVVASAMAVFLSKRLPWLGITDDPANCHSIPLNTLLIILVIGFAIGLLATRFLLLPLVKRDDVP